METRYLVIRESIVYCSNSVTAFVSQSVITLKWQKDESNIRRKELVKECNGTMGRLIVLYREYLPSYYVQPHCIYPKETNSFITTDVVNYLF